LISPATRLQGFFVWGLMQFIVEGIAFFLTGLQSRVVLEGPDAGEWSRRLLAAAITVVVVILIRFVWVFPATYLPSLLRGRRMAVSRPPWQETFLISFTGIRGVVSLVAALSIPQWVGSDPFPDRDLILFVTFCVILASLLGQGASLPRLIRFLGLDRAGVREADAAKHDEVIARVVGIEAALERLGALEQAGAISRSAAAASLRRWNEDRRLGFMQTADTAIEGAPIADQAGIQLQLLAAERSSIAAQFAAGKLTDEARRRIERELDLQDARLRHVVESATGLGIGDT
jgi:CPA1 family monovalent cation:H+ antiporter